MTRNSLLVCIALSIAGCGPEPEPPNTDPDGDGIHDSSDWCNTVYEEPNG